MYLMVFSVFFPIAAGVCLLAKKEWVNRRALLAATAAALAITGAAVAILLFTRTAKLGQQDGFLLGHLAGIWPICFKIDGISVIFSGTALVVMECAGFYSFAYMKHERKEKRYYGFYLMVFGVLNALCFAGNAVTFYLFFELLTLVSVSFVLHDGSREAVMAGLKYLFYSLCGAYCALFGLYIVSRYSADLTFTPGGVLPSSVSADKTGILLLAAFFMVIGFGVKAGMFPMHAWLPSAHPVAPAPASAVLSAVIVKAGALAALRMVYYIFGTSFLRGTWVQTAWQTLALITVFMGSLLAYREPLMKKRLAYSTVSQLSYILFGFALMDGDAVTGSLLHVMAHGCIKAALFLCAGAVIHATGNTDVSGYRGIGRTMPVILWCYTIVSLGLIGIPPFGGFVSKWYLAMGALSGQSGTFRYLGPVVLLVSALLTAGYLLPPAMQGFFPGSGYEADERGGTNVSKLMTAPIVVLSVLSVLMGVFPGMAVDGIAKFIGGIV